MCKVEDLFFILWLWAVSVLRKMVLGSLVGRKITWTVWVARVYQVIFFYKTQQFGKFELVQLQPANATLEDVYLWVDEEICGCTLS